MRRPDGMSYGPRPTPDTPFTDHPGGQCPPGHFIFRHHVVNARQLPPVKRLDNKSFVNRPLLVYLLRGLLWIAKLSRGRLYLILPRGKGRAEWVQTFLSRGLKIRFYNGKIIMAGDQTGVWNSPVNQKYRC